MRKHTVADKVITRLNQINGSPKQIMYKKMSARSYVFSEADCSNLVCLWFHLWGIRL